MTGAGRGIGRAVAELLAARGAAIDLLARSESELLDVTDGINSRGCRVVAHSIDVLDEEALRRAFATIGPADIPINSAGANRPKVLLDITADDLDALLGLNVRSTFRTCQLFVGHALGRQSGGVIVNVSSQMGHVGAPQRSLYCAIEHAAEGMTKALAVELAPHEFRVVSVAPTSVETAMTRPFLEDPVSSGALLAKLPVG